MNEFDEELHRKLIERMPDGVYRSTHDGKFLEVNPAMVKMLGYASKEELLAIDIPSELYFDPVDRESRVLEERLEEIGIFRLRKKDGSGIWVEDHGWYNTDDKGNITTHEGILRDVSERVMAEEALKKTELEFRTLFESAHDAIFIVNNEIFVECNLMTLTSFGCEKKEDIINHAPWEFSPPFQPDGSDSKEKAKIYMQAAAEGTPQRFYWKHCRKDHSLFDAEVSLNRVAFRNDFYLQAIVRDTTEQKQSEREINRMNQELRELNATKDRFFSLIAHDLRSPFNALLGLAQMISDPDEHLSLEDSRKLGGKIHSMLLNQYNFLQNLLGWSRMQQGRVEFHPEKTNISLVAMNVIDLLSGNLLQKKIEITNNINDDTFILADSDMLSSILLNIISNAIKFTPKYGKIVVDVNQTEDQTEILVSDTGIGISQEDCDKLFRLDTIFTKKGTEGEKGSGLGILLCKEMVKKHGGTLEINSVINAGTTVKIGFPKRCHSEIR